MGTGYDIEVKVISRKGACSAGHEVGDSWVIGSKTKEGMCVGAYNAVSPYIQVLRFGGELPWANEKGAAEVACPDADNPVVLKLTRLK